LKVGEAPRGRTWIIGIDSNIYRQVVAEKERERFERMTRPMRIDPRGVPFIQVQAPLVPIAYVFGIIEAGILVAMTAGAAAALFGEAVATGATIAEGAVAAEGAGGVIIPIGSRAAARWVTSKITQSAAAGVIAYLGGRGISKAEAAEAVKPFIDKRIIALGNVTGAPDGQSYNAIIRLSTDFPGNSMSIAYYIVLILGTAQINRTPCN
jgi:hypothetical protein